MKWFVAFLGLAFCLIALNGCATLDAWEEARRGELVASPNPDGTWTIRPR